MKFLIVSNLLCLNQGMPLQYSTLQIKYMGHSFQCFIKLKALKKVVLPMSLGTQCVIICTVFQRKSEIFHSEPLTLLSSIWEKIVTFYISNL